MAQAQGKPSGGGFAVFGQQIAPGGGHGLDDLVQIDFIQGGGDGRGDQKGVIGLDGPHGVAFNARDLDIPAYRVAGESEVVFQCGFGRVFRDPEAVPLGVGNKCCGHG